MTRIIQLNRSLTRRTALQASAGVAAMAALGGWPVRAQGNFDWQRFKGESIEVILAKSPRADLLQRHQAEFEEKTGITVGAEQHNCRHEPLDAIELSLTSGP